MALATAEATVFLQDQPFRDFLGSPFYVKLLQWKAFEMQPVADKCFTELCVLGKGGFGEVSKCLRTARMEDEGYSIKRVLFCPFEKKISREPP